MKFLLLFSLLFSMPFHKDDATTQLSVNYEGELIATLEREEFFYPPFPHTFIDHNKIRSYVDEVFDQFYQKPKNAKINDDGEIVAEKIGQTVDRELFSQLLAEALYQKEQETIEIPTKTAYPQVTSELLSEISVKKVSEYETYFNEDNKERSHNITLATKAINNIVIFPKERFSFNDIVGERTEEKGYMRAPVIVKGELSEDIGGGICQVSSTLFNAVKLRGIQIVERYSHSREVPYVPPGKDATVSWWGPDFVFQNNYSEPILIQATANHGIMQVQIFSKEHIE